jgi:hypothetical protein
VRHRRGRRGRRDTASGSRQNLATGAAGFPGPLVQQRQAWRAAPEPVGPGTVRPTDKQVIRRDGASAAAFWPVETLRSHTRPPLRALLMRTHVCVAAVSWHHANPGGILWIPRIDETYCVAMKTNASTRFFEPKPEQLAAVRRSTYQIRWASSPAASTDPPSPRGERHDWPSSPRLRAPKRGTRQPPVHRPLDTTSRHQRDQADRVPGQRGLPCSFFPGRRR